LINKCYENVLFTKENNNKEGRVLKKGCEGKKITPWAGRVKKLHSAQVDKCLKNRWYTIADGNNYNMIKKNQLQGKERPMNRAFFPSITGADNRPLHNSKLHFFFTKRKKKFTISKEISWNFGTLSSNFIVYLLVKLDFPYCKHVNSFNQVIWYLCMFTRLKYQLKVDFTEIIIKLYHFRFQNFIKWQILLCLFFTILWHIRLFSQNEQAQAPSQFWQKMPWWNYWILDANKVDMLIFLKKKH
jgi:hypothetical protein